MKKTPTTVLTVDDHPIVRDGLYQLLSDRPDLVICGHASEGTAALDLIDRLKPDLVVVDISLKKGISGIELIRLAKERQPRTFFLILSMHDESHWVRRALEAGAHGYVLKDEVTENILMAIDTIIGGGHFISPCLAASLLMKKSNQGINNLDQLSDRELEVIHLIGQGFSCREIGERLFISSKTVETYCQRIKEKLKLDNSRELILYAARRNTR